MVSFTKVAIAAIAATLQVQASSFFNNYIERALAVFANSNEHQTPQLFEIEPKEDEKIHAISFPNPGTKPVPGESPIEVCDADDAQLLSLQEVVISPNPPQAGANLTFTARGTIDKTISDGAYVEVDVRYGFIRLIHQTYDLCEEITKVDLECPIEKGQQIISKVVEIPAEVPPGKYLVNARAYTKDDEYITCLTATIVFPAK
ncbi:uncharacterized protein LODBEIA_P09170 [Lodderomyces beijingensis]|uniref:Phosphatidylglycerol/phosphatidylinositol transfer protein n=1 Tax=Lodderomyces beijingensis TaxID=1775926 RepID=A0ABP0ZGH9_9ASCO